MMSPLASKVNVACRCCALLRPASPSSDPHHCGDPLSHGNACQQRPSPLGCASKLLLLVPHAAPPSETGSSSVAMTLSVGDSGVVMTLSVDDRGVVTTLSVDDCSVVTTLSMGDHGVVMTLSVGHRGAVMMLSVGESAVMMTLSVGDHGVVVVVILSVGDRGIASCKQLPQVAPPRESF